MQVKNWARNKIIREKYLYQLESTTRHYKQEMGVARSVKVTPVFYTTIDPSDTAKKVIKDMGIRFKKEPFTRDYPMIKCNVNRQTKRRTCYLPFETIYDHITIGDNPGEYYVKTVEEAENKGFRKG